MDSEWYPRKARDNLRKHGVDFADAVIALEDENPLTIEDPEHAEPRFVTLDMGPTLDVLLVVHRERSNDRDEARAAIFDYIEVFYNRQRLHQTLNYVSPEEYEASAGVY